MVNFQTVYSVGMSEECEMSKEVNEKWPVILSCKLLQKTAKPNKKKIADFKSENYWVHVQIDPYLVTDSKELMWFNKD